MRIRDLPLINEDSPDWVTIRAWADDQVAKLRKVREMERADLRDLDMALGGIKQLQELLKLPAAIQEDRKREPIADTDFGIPSL